MKSWESTLVPEGATILETVKVIEDSAKQVGLVVNEERKLLGVVTDGDVRKAILNNISMDSSVKRIMARAPTVGHVNDSRETLLQLMKTKVLRQVPIIDDTGYVVGLETLLSLVNQEEVSNRVVIMAGGFGSRLKPLTDDCPKPMLCVGEKPILETILENFLSFGFKHFYFSVNYKADMIQDYFGDGAKWGAEITYIQEKKPLGTAGALSLLPTKLEHPFMVMNGDLLTKVNFKHLLDFHYDHNAVATMCVRQYHNKIPYGVVQTNGHHLSHIKEKPVHSFFVNAGIYVISPQALKLIPDETFYDMPSLFEALLSKRESVSVFPIREYWLDIGKFNDFEQAQSDYTKMFEGPQ